MFDTFISHSSMDKESIVIPLSQYLRDRHLSVWLDQDNILAGDSILDSIRKGLNSAKSVVLIVTPNIFSSFWIPTEIGLSIGGAFTSIIPVLCDVTIDVVAEKFPWILTLKYITCTVRNKAKAFEEIFSSINRFNQRNGALHPLDIDPIAKKFYKYNTPNANRISILLSEYEKIAQISVPASISHITRIAATIITDVYQEHRPLSNIPSCHEMLEVISHQASGLNANIKAHLTMLLDLSSNINGVLFSNEVSDQRLIEMSLSAVLSWYLAYIETHNIPDRSFESLEIVDSEALSYQDFLDMYEIDKLVLREDLIAFPDITWGWYQYNQFSHIAIRSQLTAKVVGYIALLPVTDELYENIQSGYFKDNDLSTENLRRYDIPDFYKLYVACIAIHPKYQNTDAFYKLHNALIKMLFYLATEREVYITDVITEASTLQGEKLCKLFGLHKHMNTSLNTNLYTITLLPPSFRLKSNFGNKLIKFYAKKYEEFKDLL